MAEGDTILRTANRLRSALVGAPVAASSPGPRGRAAGLDRIDGRELELVETHGKNLALVFGELALHSHLGMNGSWHVYRRGERWRRPRRSAWAALSDERWEAVQFGGPTLRVMPTARLRRRLARLGPDVLAEELVPAEAVASLRRDSRAELGDALLDQSLVAGIGNIFKSEACFAAGVSPWRRIDELGEAELESVLANARSLMLAAVARGRPTPRVYRRAGEPCPVCGEPIASRPQGDANRTTYWCRRCQ